MFNKVLIAEDHELANISVRRTIGELGVQTASYVYYCDDALAWISAALKDNVPYDLLITDLSFEEDNNVQRIANGIELIKAVKVIQPQLKIIVFSSESRPAVIDDLFLSHDIDGYVRKARRDAEHLKEAFRSIFEGKEYISPDIKKSIKESNAYEFSTLDIQIVKLLSEGILQREIPNHLKQDNVKPFGLSSVEKRLNTMRDILGFKKNEQLVAYCIDKGFI